MRDSTRRSLRTAMDLILGVLLSLGAIFLIPGINDQINDLGLGKAFAVFGMIVLILTTVVTKFKNYLEDGDKIPALLKAPASDGANPVPNRGDTPR